MAMQITVCRMSAWKKCFLLCATAGLLIPASVGARKSYAQSKKGIDPAVYEKVTTRGIDYLRKSQAPDGSYTAQAGIGVTALVATALLRNGLTPQDPTVAKSLKLLDSYVQKDGGIYNPKGFLRTYETCLAITCFIEANQNKKYDKTLAAANKFLRTLQFDEQTDRDKSDIYYGGAGYGNDKRPDLSNTAFMIEALRASGSKEDDDAIKKALIFVSRCQNLESEHNTTPYPAKNPDGGSYYTPTEEGGSPAGKTDNGGLRSYAAMTYAGLKSMIYAGLKADDPRVKASVEWIRKNYDMQTNPGLGTSGLFYNYVLMSKALSILGENPFVDAKGTSHNWRREMVEEMAKRQRADGSWVNDDKKWLEDNPNLVSGYALLALSYCKADTKNSTGAPSSDTPKSKTTPKAKPKTKTTKITKS